MAKVKKRLPAKRESKGKQHAARAASFKRVARDIADTVKLDSALSPVSRRDLKIVIDALRAEATYLRTILR